MSITYYYLFSGKLAVVEAVEDSLTRVFNVFELLLLNLQSLFVIKPTSSLIISVLLKAQALFGLCYFTMSLDVKHQEPRRASLLEFGFHCYCVGFGFHCY